MNISNLDWEDSSLFTLVSIGDVNLFKYWLDKKKRNINVKDENEDTPLHYAVRGGHIDIVIALLEKGAVISSNKKKQNPLDEAYALLLEENTVISSNERKQNTFKKVYASDYIKAAKEITKFIVKGNLVIIDEEQRLLISLVNAFIEFLKKNYLDRNVLIRFPAKHTRRANALITAAERCISEKKISNFNELLNNQLNLLKGVSAKNIPENIIDKRWSERIRNKPKDPNSSLFYKTINTFVTERFSNIVVNNSRGRSTSHC